jgi:hypothetical protein
MNQNKSNRGENGEKRTGQGRAAGQSSNLGMALDDILSLLDAEIAKLIGAHIKIGASAHPPTPSATGYWAFLWARHDIL